MLIKVDFKNKRLEADHKLVLTDRMVHDLCYYFDKDKLSINAASFWLHYKIHNKVDIDIQAIQNKLDSLEKHGSLKKLWEAETFLGYQFNGKGIE
jgi:hypothetical protein